MAIDEIGFDEGLRSDTPSVRRRRAARQARPAGPGLRVWLTAYAFILTVFALIVLDSRTGVEAALADVSQAVIVAAADSAR